MHQTDASQRYGENGTNRLMLELAILGLLKERPMHGYELRKQLSQKLGVFWSVSFGSLYPTLKKLERRGVVEKTTTDLTPRRKHVYRITGTGEHEFLELLSEGPTSPGEEDKFGLRLAFFRYLKPEARLRLLERRRAYLEDRLDDQSRSLSRATRARADSYTIALVHHSVQTTEHDIAWLETLISAERTTLKDGGQPTAGAETPGPDDTPDNAPADTPDERGAASPSRAS